MELITSSSAFLVLQDGTVFEGVPFGFRGTSIGEVVFNTGITGYQEVLTDPSYFGQIVTFTYPELGNTGVNSFDQEADKSYVKGIIVRQINDQPSNWRSENSLNNWLVDQKVVGISAIDTRALVRLLRDKGAMNGVISNNASLSPAELLKKIQTFPSMKGLNLADEVSTKDPYNWNTGSQVDFDRRLVNKRDKPFRVVAIDFGIKRSILQRFIAHGCEVTVLPASSDISKVLSCKPEGVFLSNGPGDPSAVDRGIALARNLIKQADLPVFGICLGHQIIGLALGAKTFKLPFGHRGLNHPCGNRGELEITSQNHGFAIDPLSLSDKDVSITHFNLNDKTVAGISMNNRPVFGVQYHPEASPGPHDADHHFARFVSLMAERR